MNLIDEPNNNLINRLIDDLWLDQGFCNKCGWHGDLFDHDFYDQDFLAIVEDCHLTITSKEWKIYVGDFVRYERDGGECDNEIRIYASRKQIEDARKYLKTITPPSA